MSTINDPIRQAPMFTMNGLVDPRFFEMTGDKQYTRRASSRKHWNELFGIVAFIEGFALRRSIFRYKRLKA